MFKESDLFSPPFKTIIRLLNDELFALKKITVQVLDFENGPVALRGNKWFKLKFNLLEASRLNQKTLLTFGGAYSNHIAATACASKLFGFHAIGIIRGEETLPLSKTIREAKANGMQIFYESRSNYRNKENPEYIAELKNRFGDFYLIPEGGSNNFALTGCKDILQEINVPFDFICCACGTGATLAGLSTGLQPGYQALGFPVLKGAGFLNEKIMQMIDQPPELKKNWQLIEDYHFGGYAKTTKELLDFVDSFYLKHKIRIEPVYTGKLFYALYDLIKKDYFKPGSRIMVLHSGGLQYLPDQF